LITLDYTKLISFLNNIQENNNKIEKIIFLHNDLQVMFIHIKKNKIIYSFLCERNKEHFFVGMRKYFIDDVFYIFKNFLRKKNGYSSNR